MKMWKKHSKRKSIIFSINWPLITAMKSRYIELLRQYHYIGGMPEAVQTYLDTQNLDEVRQIQRDLLLAYEQDFSKHIPDSQTVQRVRVMGPLNPSFLRCFHI